MTVLLYLIPAALAMGLLGLAAFLWSMRAGQYDDLDGAAHRVLFDENENENDNDNESEDAKRDGSGRG